MKTPIEVSITHFKSILNTSFKLSPVTVLIGPPASGKSNILDAILFAGYFGRLIHLKDEYEGSVANLEPLGELLRATSAEQLFAYAQLEKRVQVVLRRPDTRMKVEMHFEQGTLFLSVNFNRTPLKPNSRLVALEESFAALLEGLSKSLSKQQVLEARLYAYDRLALSLPYCLELTVCGFMQRAGPGGTATGRRLYPKSILSEYAWNVKRLRDYLRSIIPKLNEILNNELGERVEVKVLRDGSIVIFDYDVEIDPVQTSDSIPRILYYLAALRSAVNYAKKHGLENRLVVLLEEPESHTFPFLAELLAENIVDASKNIYVVLTIHNPLLLSKLWDYARNIVTYYVYRDYSGSTHVVAVDVEKLAEELVTSDELLYMHPRRVIEKYAVALGD